MNRPEPIELENNLGPDAVTGEINRVPWMAYDVDEMDLYIAEKDAEIAELIEKNKRLANKDIIMASETIKDLYKELRHSNYKRCLAMAEWCNANCMHTVLLIGHKITPHWEWRIKTNYWYKWRKIWFELYKKFKEGN